MKKTNYKKSGVDVKKADSLVRWIKQKTSVSLYPLGTDYACFYPFPLKKYKNPILVSSTDGVGTKLKLASYFLNWGGIGQDLLAMCVNDLICTGAKPLFFLDYYACGHLKKSQARSFLKGLQKACEEASCPLLGGETAEMPGLYQASDIDCAGFCVGVVEKSKILKSSKVRLGDDVVAFKSSGFHSNGYSLLRKLYSTPSDLKKHQEILMRATRLYTFLVPLLDQISGLKVMAHITGGGLDNLSRVLPKTLTANLNSWAVPSCFLDVKKKAQLSWKELLQTFNCGLGLVLVIKKKEALYKLLPKEEIVTLGKIGKRTSPFQAWSLNFKKMESHNLSNQD